MLFIVVQAMGDGVLPSSLIAYLNLAWFAPREMMLPFQDFPFLACSLTEEAPQVRNVLAEGDFVDALLRLRALSLSGALSRQAIQTRISAEQLWRAGQSAVLIGQLDTVSAVHAETLRTHPEWAPEWVVLNTDGRRAREPMNQHGMAMPLTAPTPERTLLLLNELFSNKALQDHSTAGIPGIHRQEGSVYQPAEMALSYPYPHSGVRGWANFSLMMPPGEGEWLEQEVSARWLKNPE